MQTSDESARELPFFTKISNLKISPPLATALGVALIALGFALYFVFISSCLKPNMPEQVHIVSINQPMDSVRVISPGGKRIDMILTGQDKTDVTYLESNKAYAYVFKTNKKVKGTTTLVKDTVYLVSSTPDTLTVDESWKHISNKDKTIPRARLAFVEYPYLLMWTILIALLNAVAWVAGIYLIYKCIQYLKQMEVSARRKTWVVLIAIAAVFLYFILSQMYAPLDYREICSAFGIIFKPEKVNTLFTLVTHPTEICGIMAAGVLLMLPFLSYYALKDPALDNTSKKIEAQKVIRDDFVLLVTFMSGLILTGLITTGLMYQALLYVLGQDFQYLIPREFTVVYGLKYSIVLAMFYFPVYYSLQQARENLRQSLLNSGSTSDDLNTQLGSTGMSTKFWDRFKIITAALTPLLGSLGMEFVKLITDLH